MKHPRYNLKKTSQALGLRIRELRNERGWTLEECEERGYKNWRHLQAVESGQNITFHTLLNIANMFGISLGQLVDGL
jgi:transcriptional regulator with XRE-family HTH domain